MNETLNCKKVGLNWLLSAPGDFWRFLDPELGAVHFCNSVGSSVSRLAGSRGTFTIIIVVKSRTRYPILLLGSHIGKLRKL